jgi:hypothetical protein
MMGVKSCAKQSSLSRIVALGSTTDFWVSKNPHDIDFVSLLCFAMNHGVISDVCDITNDSTKLAH